MIKEKISSQNHYNHDDLFFDARHLAFNGWFLDHTISSIISLQTDSDIFHKDTKCYRSSAR